MTKHDEGLLHPLSVLDDRPIDSSDQDELNLSHWARIVTRVALGMRGPFTIGLLGPWGSGKTSILNLTRRLIEQHNAHSEQRVTTVVFDAWRYEQEETPLVPLIATIIRGLGDTSDGPVARLRDGLRAILYGLSFKGGGEVPWVGKIDVGFNTDKVIGRYEELRQKWVEKQLDSAHFFNLFEALSSPSKTQDEATDSPRLIVLIDDLDRCLPERAVRLLEYLKLVFVHPGFVFVLALDQRFLEAHLEQRFRKETGIKGQGQRYLEKLIPLPIWIPRHSTRFDNLARKTLQREPFKGHWVINSATVELLGWACEHNPRRFGRFLNDLLVDEELWIALYPGETFCREAFVVDRGLRHQSRLLHQVLSTNTTAREALRECEPSDICTAIESQLSGDSPIISDSLKNAFVELYERKSVQNLLASQAGQNWLAEEEIRRRVDEFLSLRDPEEAAIRAEFERRNWACGQVEMALERLEREGDSVDQRICFSILALASGLDEVTRQRACGAMIKLRESKNHQVAETATLVLEKLQHESPSQA